LSISSESVQLPSPDVIVIGPWKERGKRTVILPSFVKTFRENGSMVSMACCKHGIDYCQHSSHGAQGESHHFRRDRPVVGADMQQRSLSRSLRAPILMSHEPYIDVHTSVLRVQIQVLPLSLRYRWYANPERCYAYLHDVNKASLFSWNREGMKRRVDDICSPNSAIPLIHAKEVGGFSV